MIIDLQQDGLSSEEKSIAKAIVDFLWVQNVDSARCIHILRSILFSCLSSYEATKGRKFDPDKD